MYNLFKNFITIGLIDFSHLILKKFCTYKKICTFDNIARWFYIHALCNLLITYYSYDDALKCINSSNCYEIKWNNNSYNTYYLASLLHIYHCIFFKLKFDDYLHHFLMVVLCGTFSIYMKSIISSLALFFLCGLPGFLDYVLLFLVKLNLVNKLTEKYIYLYISLYLRSPGCLLTVIIGSLSLKNLNQMEYIILLNTILLIFWNGQYYLNQSCISYYNNLYKNKIKTNDNGKFIIE
tara:strand:- start:1615 stop:2322 length:708 start_codon:yes stop_codon:yes gene_type:complete